MSEQLLHRVGLQRQQRDLTGTRRCLETFWPIDARHVQTAQGSQLLSFAANDYLGLRLDPRLSEALADGARRFGVGAGASHLLGGQHPEHVALAEALAAWTGQQAAILFASGYCAALGTLPALLRRGDRVLHDRLNHACLLDASILARAQLQRYPHLDLDALARRLSEPTVGATMVVSDSVFSMDGDQAQVSELHAQVVKADAVMLLDEAHAIGTCGPQGAGLARAATLDSEHLLVMGTLGKALGVSGAFVAGRRVWVDHLHEHARSFVYSTATPPALAYATRIALGIAQSEPERRDALRLRMAELRLGCHSLGLNLLPSSTPIQPLLLGSSEQATALALFLRQQGIYVPAIRAPTVPEGSARLRISLSAAHLSADVVRLLQALSDWQAKRSV